MSGDASGAGPARMDEPGSNGAAAAGLAERLVLAALGAVSTTGARAEELADLLAARTATARSASGAGGPGRRDVGAIGDRAAAALASAFRELGLVTRDELEDLELRIAQLEHRLRLLEQPPGPPPARGIRV